MNLPYSHDHQSEHIHIWHCRFVIPKSEESKWATNMNIAVAAVTLLRAVDKVRERYPTAVLYGVNHGGLFIGA